MKTKGIFLIKNGKSDTAFKEKEYTLASLKDDEVLIEAEAFGLNYAEVMARNGLYQDCPELPCVLGYEAVGTIIDSKNNKRLIGKRVLAFCRFGAYSKHVITKENAIIEINDINCADALALCTQGVTAYYMAHYISPIKKEDRVLIHAAAGGVGSILIQLAKINGGIVYAKVGGKEKEAIARKLGADYVINYKNKEYANELITLLKNKKLDAVFNPVGGSTFKKDFNLLDSGGKIYLYGASELMRNGWKAFNIFRFIKKMGILLPVKLIASSKSIIGVNMLRIADNKPKIIQECLNDLIKLYNQRLLKPEIGRTFNASQISEAHKFLESGESTGKIIVHWE